jgi:hypothetical protein
VAGVVWFLRNAGLDAAEYGADVSVVAGKALAAAFSTKIALENPVGGCCQTLSGLGNTVLCSFVHLRLDVFAEIVRLKDESLIRSTMPVNGIPSICVLMRCST